MVQTNGDLQKAVAGCRQNLCQELSAQTELLGSGVLLLILLPMSAKINKLINWAFLNIIV